MAVLTLSSTGGQNDSSNKSTEPGSHFKVIISSVPWAPDAKLGSHDTWDGFPQEREETTIALATYPYDDAGPSELRYHAEKPTAGWP